MKYIKKLIIISLLLGLLGINSAFAQRDIARNVIVINNSEEGYMTIHYGFCNPHCSTQRYTLTLYSKKNSSPDKPYYAFIDVPSPENFNTLVIHSVYEKEIVDGKPTEIERAKTYSAGMICEGNVAKYDGLGPHAVLSLSDMNGSPLIGCTVAQS